MNCDKIIKMDDRSRLLTRLLWLSLLLSPKTMEVFGLPEYARTGISRGKYQVYYDSLPAGFVIRKEGFFRYATEPSVSAPPPSPPNTGGNPTPAPTGGGSPSPGGSTPPTGGSSPTLQPPSPPPSPPSPPSAHIHFLDVDKMKKYYKRTDSDGNVIDTDVQLLEWPGKTSKRHQAAFQDSLAQTGVYCSHEEDSSHVNCPSHMLKFDRDNGKIQHYPCNAQEGTTIVALAAIKAPEELKDSTNSAIGSTPDPGSANLNPEEKEADDDSDSSQKLWLSHGPRSIYTRYIRPMFIPETVLLDMVHDEGDFCRGIMPNDHQSSSDETSKNSMLDLRTVLDFTFVEGVLILGMKCGIILVSGLTKENLDFEASVLRTEVGHSRNLFPEPINKVSASVCCSLISNCGKHQGMVAAYSYNPARAIDDNKFIYLSFNKGGSFDKKIIASKYSPINLIVGMYKLYTNWYHYYEYLNNPDEEDLQNDDNMLKSLREKEMWASSTIDGKEKLFGLGITQIERKIASLRKIAEILRDQVQKRQQRFQSSMNEDFRPRWLQTIFNETRKKAGWKDDWTDENCDTNPDCTKLFANDTAVEWLLQDANITVKTPRDTSNITCKEVVSILVIPEEKQVIGLCRVEIDNNSTDNQLPNQSPPSNKRKRETRERSFIFDYQKPVKNATLSKRKHKRQIQETTDQLNDSSIHDPDLTQNNRAKPMGRNVNENLEPKEDEEFGFFAFFKFDIETTIPTTHLTLVSQRIFYCKFIKNDMDPDKPRLIQPEIIRIPGSVTIFVINCEGTVYVSTNFGNTLFNAAFYYHMESIEGDCEDNNSSQPGNSMNSTASSSSGNLSGSTVQLCDNRPETETPNHVRSFYLCALNVPPIITADHSGSVLLMTFGRFFARGAIAYNRETRLIVGESLDELSRERRFENIVFPGLNSNGEVVLAISLAQAYSVPDTKFRNVLYKNRHAVRLVQMPIELYREVREYYTDNEAVCSNAKEKGLAFSKCETISFSAKPKQLALDLGETEIVKVKVKDDNPYLPLWIFSSNGNSVEMKAYYNQRKDSQQDDLSSHNWDVEIKVKQNLKNFLEGEHLVEAFFGADYNIHHDFSTQISLVNTPNVRCHVQPSATVNVEIGCKGKRLVAYEQAHRPQCKQFRQFFNYTLKKGMFDPDLASYWIEKERLQTRPYFKILPSGDLSVTYDYASWGCPLEPYTWDAFIPDLRIVEEGENITEGNSKRFEGKFVLIEIFGGKGYSYRKKFKDIEALKGCQRRPQRLDDLIREWKHRQRLFHIANQRLVFPSVTTDLDTVKWLHDVRGNGILENEAVKEHINIWNRANYIDCMQYENNDLDTGLTDAEWELSYEIMESAKEDKLHDDDDDDDETNGGGDKTQTDSQAINEDDSTEDDEEVAGKDHYEGDYEHKEPNVIDWSNNDRQRVYLFLAVAVDEYNSLCNYQTLFGVSLKGGATDISDLYSFLIFLLFVIFWILLMIGGFYIRKKYLKTSYINHARLRKLEEAAWLVVYRYEKMIHDAELSKILRSQEELKPTDETREEVKKTENLKYEKSEKKKKKARKSEKVI